MMVARPSVGETIVPWQGTLGSPAPVAKATGRKAKMKSKRARHFRGRFITANSLVQQSAFCSLQEIGTGLNAGLSLEGKLGCSYQQLTEVQRLEVASRSPGPSRCAGP